MYDLRPDVRQEVLYIVPDEGVIVDSASAEVHNPQMQDIFCRSTSSTCKEAVAITASKTKLTCWCAGCAQRP